MTKWLILTCAMMVSFLSLWGWGWLVRRCTRSPVLSLPLTAALGLGAVIFLGGTLNLARLAFRLSLDLLVLAGIGMAVIGWLKRENRQMMRPTMAALLTALPIMVTGWFLANYVMPAAAFNIHDDLERYFAYPLKMLATGTLAPNRLGYLGADTLGAQALLHAFAAAHFPIEYIGSVDLAGCLLFCLVLAGFGIAPSCWAITAIAAEFLLVAVNPQVVNISSLFSGVALVMAVTLLTGEQAVADRKTGAAPLFGLLYAALIALKSTLVVYVAVHLLVTALTGLRAGRNRTLVPVMAGIWTLIFLAPWLALHAPLYLAATKTALPTVAPVAKEPLDLFSNTILYYGSAQLHYTGLALTGLALAAWGSFIALRRPSVRGAPMTAVLGAGVTAALVYLVFVSGIGPLMYGREAATRYAVPILLGIVTAVLRMLEVAGGKNEMRWFTAVPTGCGLCLALVFTPSLTARLKQIAAVRVPLVYFANGSAQDMAGFLAYNDEVLHGPVRTRLEQMQKLVPPGETLAAWVMTPFLLDFQRNPILQTDPYGIAMPWAQWPPDARYLLLQYSGPAVRTAQDYQNLRNSPGMSDRLVEVRVREFINRLEKISRRENIVQADDTYVLLRLPPP